jgi:hypothetical protein
MLDRTQTQKAKPAIIDPEIAHIQAALDDYRAGGKTITHEEATRRIRQAFIDGKKARLQ